MQEFRVLGWSDRAAACLSVEKTGGVITAAGLIMSVSFLGLLIPKTVVLNQYGFTLFVAFADGATMRPTYFAFDLKTNTLASKFEVPAGQLPGMLTAEVMAC